MTILSTEQRRFVISLWIDGGHTQVEIANLVGLTQGSISKILKRARRYNPNIPIRLGSAKKILSPKPLVFTASQLGPMLEPTDLDLL
jgi:DNA-binding XRE family transcriptional regulator